MSEADDLYREGVEAFRRGDDERSRELKERSLTLAHADGDSAATVKALVGLARLALRAGDLEQVHALAAEAREVAPDDAVRALPLHPDAEAVPSVRSRSRAAPPNEAIAPGPRSSSTRPTASWPPKGSSSIRPTAPSTSGHAS